MEELRAYLNSLSPAEQQRYAELCGTSVSYLRKAISLNQKFDGALARLLDFHSSRVVRKELLRPDIWPELLTEHAA
jgi:hypothetical protein